MLNINETMVSHYNAWCSLRGITPRNDVMDTMSMCAGYYDEESTVRVDVCHPGLVTSIVWTRDTGPVVWKVAYNTHPCNKRDWIIKVMVQQPAPKGYGWSTCIEKHSEDKFIRRGMRKRYSK